MFVCDCQRSADLTPLQITHIIFACNAVQYETTTECVLRNYHIADALNKNVTIIASWKYYLQQGYLLDCIIL